VIAVGVASKELFIWMVLAGVSVTELVPFVMNILHDVMSDAGRDVPVAPFVVIVPLTLYPF
jgi:hypothetical protein